MTIRRSFEALRLLVFSLLIFSASAFAKEPAVKINFTLSPMGSFIGTTNDLKGQVAVRGSQVMARNIVVNLKNLKTGIALRDRHTQERLETDKFPEAVLIEGRGANGTGRGKFKIKGVERMEAGTYKIDKDVVVATFKLKLSNYGIKDIKYLGVGLEDEITLTIRAPARQLK